MNAKPTINGHSLKSPTENLSSGYIKVFRSIAKKSWYKKSDFVHLFIHLLIQAAHSGYETLFNGATKILKPGQLVTGRKKLSSETGINESKVERILKFFEIEQQIEQQKTTTSRLITIINWIEYQKNEQQFKQPVNNDRTTSEQPVNTIQEGLRRNNNEKECVSSTPTHTDLNNKINDNDAGLYQVFQSWEKWIKANAPEVWRLPYQIPFTHFKNFFAKLPEPRGEEFFKKILFALNDWPKLHERHRSVSKAITSWMEKEKVDTDIIWARECLKSLKNGGGGPPKTAKERRTQQIIEACNN